MSGADDTFPPPMLAEMVVLDTSVQTEQTVAKKKRARVKYNMEKVFDTKEAALEYLDAEKCWATKKTTMTMEGRKIQYRCNKEKLRGVQCSASVFLLLDRYSFRSKVHRSLEGHDCETSTTKTGSAKMTEEVKRVIEDLYALKKKPLFIVDHLSKKGMPTPTTSQVANYVAKMKAIKFGPSTLSIGELLTLLDKFSSVPETPDGAYMVHEIDAHKQTFRVYATTKALSEKVRHARAICADGTSSCGRAFRCWW